MSQRRTSGSTVHVLVLLGAVAVVGFCAVRGGTGDLWPVGLATGTLCVVPRRARRATVAALLAIAVVSMWWGGRPLDVALGLAVGATAGSWVVWRLIQAPEGLAPGLMSDRDLSRFLVASMSGALVAAAVAVATSVLTEWKHPAIVGLTTGLAHLAAQLVVLPFFMRVQTRLSLASPGETAAMWLTTGAVTPLVFYSVQVPALVFLIIPTLVWGALRIDPRQALWQVSAVSLVGFIMTKRGFGPFAGGEGQLGLGVHGPDLFAELFIIACVLAVVPLLLNVGQQVDRARDAVAEDDNLNQIMESALVVAIIGTDVEGRITFFSPGAQRLLGYSPDEVLGRTTRMLHDPAEITAQAEALGVEDDFDAVMQVFVDIPRFGAGRDLRYLSKDGQQRTHATSIVRRTDGHGNTSGFVITSDDVTDRVRAQESLVEALDVERRAVDRLRQIDQIKDDLISTVSHELRTPITSIVGYVELFEEGAYGALDARQLEALERVTSNSARLLTLIDKLLTLSRIQDESLSLVDEPVDLCEVVQAGYDVVANESRTRGLDVRLEVPAAPVPFLGDGEMLERVVVNLVDNAIKFTPPAGRVTVRLTATDDDVLLEVADTGIGIPADEQALLFTRFFRSSLAKEQQIPGSGLGLSITRAVVEMHGGWLDVASSPEGTTLGVHLPRRRAGHPPPPEAFPQPNGSARRLELVPSGDRVRLDEPAVDDGFELLVPGRWPRSARRLDADLPANAQAGREPGAHPQEAQHGGDVRAHGADAHAEGCRDGLVLGVGRQQGEDLPLPLGQVVETLPGLHGREGRLDDGFPVRPGHGQTLG
jgi:PAS domain S-box-containing protein